MARPKKPKVKKLYRLMKYWPGKSLDDCQLIYDSMLYKQNARCARCNRHASEFTKKLAVDHRHSDGLVRALVCFPCNRYKVSSQKFEDVELTYNYLKKYEGR